MKTQALIIHPFTGGRVVRHEITAPSAAELIKRMAWLIRGYAQRYGLSPLAIDYELETV